MTCPAPVSEVESGATLTDGKLPYTLRSMYVPDPVMSLAIKVAQRCEE